MALNWFASPSVSNRRNADSGASDVADFFETLLGALRKRVSSDLDRLRPKFVVRTTGTSLCRLRRRWRRSRFSEEEEVDAGECADTSDEDLFPCYILQSGVYKWKGRYVLEWKN